MCDGIFTEWCESESKREVEEFVRNRHFLPRDATAHETDAVSGHSIRARTGRTRTQRKGRVRNARACLRVCYHVPVGGHSLPAPPRDVTLPPQSTNHEHTHTERTVRSCVCVPSRAAIRRRVSQAERVGATNARSNGLFTVPGVCHRERERERGGGVGRVCFYISVATLNARCSSAPTSQLS